MQMPNSKQYSVGFSFRDVVTEMADITRTCLPRTCVKQLITLFYAIKIAAPKTRDLKSDNIFDNNIERVFMRLPV